MLGKIEKNGGFQPSVYLSIPDKKTCKAGLHQTGGGASFADLASEAGFGRQDAHRAALDHMEQCCRAIRRDTHKNGYSLRSLGRGLVKDIHRSLSLCGVSVLRVGSGNASLVVRESSSGLRADLEGTMSCKSAWACPVCAPRLANARAKALQPQVAAFMQRGFTAYLLTFTVRHKRNTPLDALLDKLGVAWRGLMQSRDYVQWRHGFPEKPEWSRGWDMTHGNHGWHPHMHMMLLLPPSGTEKDAAELLAFWMKQARLAGLTVSRDAQDVQRLDNPEAAARYAVSPAAVYEAVALAKKQGTGAGKTPFQILELAVADEKAGVSGSRWVALWREYVEATKGRRLVATSRGLKLKADAALSLEDDDEPLKVDRLVAFDRVAIRALDRSNLMPHLLLISESLDCPWSRRSAIVSFLKGRCIPGLFWPLPVVDDVVLQ